MTKSRSSLESGSRPEKRKNWRILAVAVGGVLGTLLVGVVAGALLVFHVPIPPPVQIVPAQARHLEEEVRKATSQAGPGINKTLNVSEVEINSELSSQINRAANPLGSAFIVRDIRIKLIRDTIDIFTIINYTGHDISLNIAGRIHAADGYVKLDPESGQVGAMPIPRGKLENAIRLIMSNPQARERFRLPSNVGDLFVSDGRMVIVFR